MTDTEYREVVMWLCNHNGPSDGMWNVRFRSSLDAHGIELVPRRWGSKSRWMVAPEPAPGEPDGWEESYMIPKGENK